MPSISLTFHTSHHHPPLPLFVLLLFVLCNCIAFWFCHFSACTVCHPHFSVWDFTLCFIFIFYFRSLVHIMDCVLLLTSIKISPTYWSLPTTCTPAVPLDPEF